MTISLILKLKTHIQLYGMHFFRLRYVINIVKKTYQNTPSYSISKHYRLTEEPENPDLIYGELSVDSFLYLLTLIPKNKNCKIYDLGCGDGKLLLAAVLFFKNLQAVGIEKIVVLQNIGSSMTVLMQTEIKKNHSSLNFRQDNFLNKNFSDADIVYVNGAVLEKKTWDQLCGCFETLVKNSYLISVENKVNNLLFFLIYVGIHDASWGKARIYIYQKNEFNKT